MRYNHPNGNFDCDTVPDIWSLADTYSGGHHTYSYVLDHAVANSDGNADTNRNVFPYRDSHANQQFYAVSHDDTRPASYVHANSQFYTVSHEDIHPAPVIYAVCCPFAGAPADSGASHAGATDPDCYPDENADVHAVAADLDPYPDEDADAHAGPADLHSETDKDVYAHASAADLHSNSHSTPDSRGCPLDGYSTTRRCLPCLPQSVRECLLVN